MMLRRSPFARRILIAGTALVALVAACSSPPPATPAPPCATPAA
ncbi:MAG: hypothetical protein JWP97_6589, partial [Labilithrix sp.]|nr:hypothetical protein [Labilithrix sp.]